MAYRVERVSKLAMYGCQDCGDCSLPDCAYLCPKNDCSKCGRNGPCGGSADGRCELDDKECFWARIYERLKYYGESETMLDRPVTIYNATLKDTSSWANTFLTATITRRGTRKRDAERPVDAFPRRTWEREALTGRHAGLTETARGPLSRPRSSGPVTIS